MREQTVDHHGRAGQRHLIAQGDVHLSSEDVEIHAVHGQDGCGIVPGGVVDSDAHIVLSSRCCYGDGPVPGDFAIARGLVVSLEASLSLIVLSPHLVDLVFIQPGGADGDHLPGDSYLRVDVDCDPPASSGFAVVCGEREHQQAEQDSGEDSCAHDLGAGSQTA